jgi:iron complex outermembrane receptor protein
LAIIGGIYLADRSSWNWANSGTQKDMDDYVKFDAGLSWENTKFRVGLNVFNVFNRYLYSGSPYGAYYYYQAEARETSDFLSDINFNYQS